MSVTELPHTADIKVRIDSPTLETLFSEAAGTLMEVLYGDERSEGITRNITVESLDNESLLTDFLSEILFVSEVDGLVFSTAEVHIEGTHLSAVLSGEGFNPEKHSGGTEIKGISYTGMSIMQHANGYMVDIVFDV